LVPVHKPRRGQPTSHESPRDAVERSASRKDKGMSSEYSNDEKLLTKGEVAQLCRVAVRPVDRWLTAGKVGCHRTPSGRVLFRRRDVLTAVAGEQTRPRGRDR
jgi:hypothetical protein